MLMYFMVVLFWKISIRQGTIESSMIYSSLLNLNLKRKQIHKDEFIKTISESIDFSSITHHGPDITVVDLVNKYFIIVIIIYI